MGIGAAGFGLGAAGAGRMGMLAAGLAAVGRAGVFAGVLKGWSATRAAGALPAGVNGNGAGISETA